MDYSSDGNQDDEGNALAIDPTTGNVYVGGFKDSTGQGTDFVTLMYDDAGSLEWSAFWNDTADGGDTVKAIAVDADGNVSVTGSAWNGSSLDYHTLQYDNTGAQLWEIGYNDKYNFTDHPCDIALTPDGGVVVAGQAMNPGETWSYVTVKYLMHEFVVPVDSDSVSTSLRWIANRDQLLGTDGELVERVQFYSNQVYPNMYFMDDSLSYVFFQGVDTTDDDTLHRIDMTFDASSAGKRLIPLDKETYWNNYYLGHIPEGRPFVSLYDRMYMQDVWPNIDVVYSSNQRGLKYYLVVHSGGETGAIALKYHGYEDLYVDGNDALVIESEIGEVVQPQALAYEMDGSGELSLLGWQPEYDESGGVVTFDGIGSWSGDLVIEVNWGYVSLGSAASIGNLDWSTYAGNSSGDNGIGLVADNGFVYATGHTHSFNFPILNAWHGQLSNANDAYIGSFSQGAVQQWTTFLGGNSDDAGSSLAIWGSTALYGTGRTGSIDFPNVPGGFNQSSGGGTDAIIFQADVFSGVITWSTCFGGDGDDLGRGIAVNSSGGVYFAGSTSSDTPDEFIVNGVTAGSFPLVDPGNNAYYQNVLRDGKDGFIAYYQPDHGGALLWSTYFGGNCTNCAFPSQYWEDLWDIGVDPVNDEVYICGTTPTTTVPVSEPVPCQADANGDFPLCNDGGYYQTANTDGTGYIAQFSDDYVLEWCTFFGDGTSEYSLVVGSNHHLYTVGALADITFTASTGCGATGANEFPICNGSNNSYIQSSNRGGSDAILNRFDEDHNLIWSTLFGGEADDASGLGDYLGMGLRPGLAIDLDQHGNTFVAGSVSHPYGGSAYNLYYPTSYGSWYYSSALGSQSATDPTSDAYLAGFDTDNHLFWATIFGGDRLSTGSTNSPNGWEDAADIAIDDLNEKLYITGSSGSPYTPYVCPGPPQSLFCHHLSPIEGSQFDAYISQFNIHLVPVGVSESSSTQEFLKLYPNPTSGVFSLDLEVKQPEQVEIMVYDLMGNLVEKVSLKRLVGSETFEIDLDGQPSGIYLVEVRMEKRRSFGKISKL